MTPTATLSSRQEIRLFSQLLLNAMQHDMDIVGFRHLLTKGKKQGVDWMKVYSILPQTLSPDLAARLPAVEEVAPE